jgi:hypothetical protein
MLPVNPCSHSSGCDHPGDLLESVSTYRSHESLCRPALRGVDLHCAGLDLLQRSDKVLHLGIRAVVDRPLDKKRLHDQGAHGAKPSHNLCNLDPLMRSMHLQKSFLFGCI